MKRVVAIVAALALPFMGCAGQSPGDNRCAPASLRTCSCGSGEVGTQECNMDGTAFGACQCESSCTTGAACDCGDAGDVGTQVCGVGDAGTSACICPEPAACSASSLTASGSITTSGGSIDYTGTSVSATFTNLLDSSTPQAGCITSATLGFAIELGACPLTLNFGAVANGSGGVTGATLVVDSGCGALTGVPQGTYTTPAGYGLIALQSSPAISNAVSPETCLLNDTVSFGSAEIPLGNSHGDSITLSLANLTVTGSLFSTGQSGACYTTTSCASAYMSGTDGWCAPLGCPTGDHNGGDGECVTNGTCVSGYTLNNQGDCVSSPASCMNPPQANAGGDESAVTGTPIAVSGAASTGAAPLHYAWALTAKPSGSTAHLSSTTAETVTFTPDLSGTYDLQLIVTDEYGGQSSSVTTSVLAGAAASKVQLTLRVTWDSDHGDVDLHYVEPGGSLFDLSTNGGDSWVYDPAPDWGPNGPDGLAGNNPGFGAAQPEGQAADQHWGGSVGESNEHPPTNVQANLFDGVFTPVVHYYCAREVPGVSGSSGPVTATIHVLVNGTEVYTSSQMLNQRDVWPAAAITVSGGGTSASVAASGERVTSVPVGMYTDDNEDLGGCTADTN